ncbi:MAG: ribonuclease R [Bacilli bacterium]|nr:ribonuclease R [Bacilli bacterium]
MKEKILTYLQKEKKALEVIDIYNLLALHTIDELNEITALLDEMQKNGEIFRTNKGKYILFDNCPGVYCGKLQVNRKGFGFVLIPKEDDLYISADNLNGAINNDLVTCEITKKGLKPEGRVIEILKRDLKNIVGEIVLDKRGKMYFKPEEDNLGIKIKLEQSTLKNCVEGSKVLVSIGKTLAVNTYAGAVIKVLGHKNDPKMDIKCIAYKYGIYDDFGKDVEKELENIPTKVLDKDLYNRRDLTNKMIFTIDGADTKDIDDAISLEMEDDNYRLGVHIADVSYYVKDNTALGDAAFERGTSSYLADTVIPMLPHKLSNGICSLNEGVIRLSITCDMVINKNGNVIVSEIYPSYIKSRKKMTYKDVNKILMDNEVPDGYEECKETLLKMNELAKLLRKNQVKKGYIDFDLDEPKIIQDDDGVAIDIIKVERGDGEKLIENFMIIANETVAEYISNMDLPFIYRVHDIPSEEKIEDFLKLVKQLGYKLETKVNSLTPLTMQKLLNELHEKKEFKILSSMLLRSMKKAVYTKDNIGHFGLASENYTHFTSPIRRFPDLTVHRLLRTYLFNNDMSMNTINYYNSALVQIAEHSSEREQAAINAERDVDDMKMAEYMERHIGEEYDGIITSVTSFGFFVELPNLIEGLVHVRNLKDDMYNYVPDLLSLVGKDTKKIYRIGDEVHVKVIAASKEASMIDFELCDSNGNNKQES